MTYVFIPISSRNRFNHFVHSSSEVNVLRVLRRGELWGEAVTHNIDRQLRSRT